MSYIELDELDDANEMDESLMFHESEPSRVSWRFVKDLDVFFERVYAYHTRSGLLCITVEEVLGLFQFIFIVTFITLLIHSIDYNILFNDDTSKIHIRDFLKSLNASYESFNLFTLIFLIFSSVIWLVKLIRFIITYARFLSIKQFFNEELKISDGELGNFNWKEILGKIIKAQDENRICIYTETLTELDIYHRILRKQNYLTGLFNKGILPGRFKFPFLGEYTYWSKGLSYNLEYLMFRSPTKFFLNPWIIKEDLRSGNKRTRSDFVAQFKTHLLVVAFINFTLAPLIFSWQILHAFFSYTESFKSEPSSLGSRTWSPYGKYYLRHFNELEHELQFRLNVTHKLSSVYLSQTSSYLAGILATNVAFVAGSVLTVLILAVIYDESVLEIDKILMVITILGGLVTISRTQIPEEGQVHSPDTLLSLIVSKIHYFPCEWKGNAHKKEIRAEFAKLFQLKFTSIIEETLSPILTPILLVTQVYKKADEIIDFFRNYTVNIEGIGDVCSLAHFDLRKHGNPTWHRGNYITLIESDLASDGKLEMSLVHFSCRNPDWIPGRVEANFIRSIKDEESDAVDSSMTPVRSVDDYVSNYLEDMWRTTLALQNVHHENMSNAEDQSNSDNGSEYMSTTDQTTIHF